MNTEEGRALAASKSAVKYNRTSSNMTNAYGVSIYFPYQRTSYVDSACSTYSRIDMDDSYGKCIRQFASLETSGQIAAGGTVHRLGSLFGWRLLGRLLGQRGDNRTAFERLPRRRQEHRRARLVQHRLHEGADPSARGHCRLPRLSIISTQNLIWTKDGETYNDIPRMHSGNSYTSSTRICSTTTARDMSISDWTMSTPLITDGESCC